MIHSYTDCVIHARSGCFACLISCNILSRRVPISTQQSFPSGFFEIPDLTARVP